MDSPKLSKSPISSSSASSSPVQESPFANYISSLSPINHDKASHVAQGFGFNSPPLVFTSPHISTLGRPPYNVKVSRIGEGDQKRIEESCVFYAKEDDKKDAVSVEPISSSGCVDDYLADPVEKDCVNFAYTVNSNTKQSSNVVQSSVNGLAESKNINFDKKINAAAQCVSGKSEESIEKKLTYSDKSLKIGNEQGAAQAISDEFQKFESDTFDLSFKEKECENLVEDNGDGYNGFLQKLPGSMQGGQAYEDFAENVDVDANVPVNSMTYDHEASEVQRGMSRRCLQFGETQPEAKANCEVSTNVANNMISSTSLATTEKKDLGSPRLDLTATSKRRQLVNLSQFAVNMIPQCTVPKPSGIGLHLNSIVNAIPMRQSTENIGSCSDAFEKVSASPRDGTLEVKVNTITSSVVSESLSVIESIECNMTLNAKRILILEGGDSNDAFDQQSPKKKRMKLSNNTGGGGCKRCNCKKTKCLKLYCDCFAAGIYCAEPCSCQGCFNTPEYEDTVLETRKQIESRNPLAFAPKIVQPFTEVPLSNREDGNRKTPSLARHKRGCNCKKSMCLKKYCECYQANVGCSIGCRCEGCKNVYGKKEDYSVTEEMVNRSAGERLESRVATKPNNDFLHSELCDPHHLTPTTPSFQFSDHGKNASTSRLISRRCLPSPESDLTILSYAKSPRSPRTSDSNDMLLETSKETSDIVSYCEGINYNNAVVLADEFHHTPLPNHPSVVTGSSASKARELTNLSRFQLDPRSGSLCPHSSPITPMYPLDENKKLPGIDSANGGLFDILEDDMPEILKDTSMTIKPVKASSPNGKRVSPPHKLHQFGSSTSGPLKSGRKFILKAVPSFPPLTPCIDSNKSSNQSRNNIQENRSNG